MFLSVRFLVIIVFYYWLVLDTGWKPLCKERQFRAWKRGYTLLWLNSKRVCKWASTHTSHLSEDETHFLCTQTWPGKTSQRITFWRWGRLNSGRMCFSLFLYCRVLFLKVLILFVEFCHYWNEWQSCNYWYWVLYY